MIRDVAGFFKPGVSGYMDCFWLSLNEHHFSGADKAQMRHKSWYWTPVVGLRVV